MLVVLGVFLSFYRFWAYSSRFGDFEAILVNYEVSMGVFDNASLRFVPTRREIQNSNKIAKKFKILKNAIMASFQAKIGWKRMRKRENKNYHYVSFLPDAKFKIPTK